jgi:beta-lactamase superfamily II metal-dependent hydrolase
MEALQMWNVGDGLSLVLWSRVGGWFHIDCGSSSDSTRAARTLYEWPHLPHIPGTFLLSHFHADHHNGIWRAASESPHPRLQVRQLYYPRLPAFARSQEFMVALFSLNMRILGAESGVVEYDFVRAVQRLTRSSFTVTPLSAGDVFSLDGAPFSVLWPPRKAENRLFTHKVEKALKAFDKAVELDEPLRMLAERVREETTEGPFWEKEQFEVGPFDGLESPAKNGKALPKPSKAVSAANTLLRSVANELSLAFHEGGQFLFLGDLERRDLGKIVTKLRKKRYGSFGLLVAPHHGTHWHEKLRELRAGYVLCSFGGTMAKHWKPEFQEMARCSLATWTNGDLLLSLGPRWIEIGSPRPDWQDRI